MRCTRMLSERCDICVEVILLPLCNLSVLMRVLRHESRKFLLSFSYFWRQLLTIELHIDEKDFTLFKPNAFCCSEFL